MKKTILSAALFAFAGILSAQKMIRIVERPAGFENIRNIQVAVYPNEDTKIFAEPLLPFYNVNSEADPDLTILIKGKQTSKTEIIKDAFESSYSYRDAASGQIVTSSGVVSAKYSHTIFYEYYFVLVDKIYPWNWTTDHIGYYISLNSFKNNKEFPEIKYKDAVKADKVTEHFRSVCPLVLKPAEYPMNSDELLLHINCYTLDTVLAQGQGLNAMFGEKQQSMLMFAVFKNDQLLFDKLLEKGADINLKDINQWSAFMYAKIYAREKMIQTLIDQGADTQAKDLQGRTADELVVEVGGKENMLSFIMQKDLGAIRKLVADGFDINKNESDRLAYMMSAINSNDSLIVDFFIESGIPEQTMIDNMSLSYNAGYQGSYNVLEYLLNRNVPLIDNSMFIHFWISNLVESDRIMLSLRVLNAINLDQYSFLKSMNSALKLNKLIVVQTIMSNNPDKLFSWNMWPENLNGNTVESIIPYLESLNFEELTVQHYQNLLEGADTAMNEELLNWYLSDEGLLMLVGRTKNAKINDLKEARNVFIIKGKDTEKAMAFYEKNPSRINEPIMENDLPPITFYVENNDTVMVHYLISRKAELNLSQHNPLIAAIDTNNLFMIETLIENGADVNINIVNKQVFIRSLNISGKEEFVNGAYYDWVLYKPLDYALEKKCTEAEKLLIDKGAVLFSRKAEHVFYEAFIGNYTKIFERIERGEDIPKVAEDSLFVSLADGGTKLIAYPGLNVIIAIFMNLSYDNKDTRDYCKVIKTLIDKGYTFTDNPDDPLLFRMPEYLYRDDDFVAKLIKGGALVNHENFKTNGRCPLKKAIANLVGNYKSIELLLKEGADPNLPVFMYEKITIKQYVIKIAKANGNTMIIDLFKKY